jgi:hypothetical protein
MDIFFPRRELQNLLWRPKFEDKEESESGFFRAGGLKGARKVEAKPVKFLFLYTRSTSKAPN